MKRSDISQFFFRIPKPKFSYSPRAKARLAALLLILLGVIAGVIDAPQYWGILADRINQRIGFSGVRIPTFQYPFRLGLDLAGGAHLIYKADLSNIPSTEAAEAMAGLRDVIERRVNLFGVSEPVVQVDRRASEWRLLVEIAGVTDVAQAIEIIGQTPFLEFREFRPEAETKDLLDRIQKGEQVLEDPYTIPTPLTGRFLKRANVNFNQTTFGPEISVEFDDEGAKLFESITEKNVGKALAIYLDGAPISAPVVQEKISGGSAQITGKFSVEEARDLTRRLNSGALPVPISLISQTTIGSSLGEVSLQKSLRAGMYGLLAVSLFMIFWYRLPGVVAVAALLLYTALVLMLFKLIPVTLTAAGIAGFILSVGMAVDANILIFERLKEELRSGKDTEPAIHEGFRRAWTSIRDSNVSSLITSAILFWFGTSIVKGFALTLGLGVLLSMFSAITATRLFLRAVCGNSVRRNKWLLGSGLAGGI